MILDKRKRIVAEGYDQVAERYVAWSGKDPIRLHYVDRLIKSVPHGGRILDIGCGSGDPVAVRLVEHFDVVGVDISATQVAFARRNVPAARFIESDIMEVRFPPLEFDAVCAFFSITHLPREEHAALLGRVNRWLKHGGIFVGSFGVQETSGAVENDWLGAPMYFSQFDAAANLALMREAGFEILEEEVRRHDEDGTEVSFLWLVARKSSAPSEEKRYTG